MHDMASRLPGSKDRGAAQAWWGCQDQSAPSHNNGADFTLAHNMLRTTFMHLLLVCKCRKVLHMRCWQPSLCQMTTDGQQLRCLMTTAGQPGACMQGLQRAKPQLAASLLAVLFSILVAPPVLAMAMKAGSSFCRLPATSSTHVSPS